MTFEVKSFHVSHGGIPGHLNSLDDWQDYILDLNRELHALRDSWQAFSSVETPTEVDTKKFEAAEDRLEGLKHEAISGLQDWEANRPKPPVKKRRRR